jgi:sugar (glycoside-pentoside-hexuronide) transporter
LESSLSVKRLTTGKKAVFALGDHTVNLVLSATSLLYFKFLMDYGGLEPFLAGLVVWIARIVDAFTDPGMGRLSDITRWRGERRRPYFLLGALPLGIFFALMWLSVPFESQLMRFGYYATIYIFLSLAMTCVSVPYLALIPEMASDYDERTSLNAFRSAAAVMGTMAAVGMKPIVDALGGGADAWWQAGALVGVWLVIPWFGVHAASFERPSVEVTNRVNFREALSTLASHRAFRILASAYLLARIAVDLIGAMFILYFAYWIGREEDFTPTLVLFFGVVIVSLPVWLVAARERDKRSIFILGMAWWSAIQFLLFWGDPNWPRWAMFAVPSLAAVGYAVAEMMPWAMLADVIDEAELETGERREGVYVGFFTFLRKLGGATGVLLLGLVLQLVGFERHAPRAEQTEMALMTIRVLTSLAPMAFLLLAVFVTTRYPLTRKAHSKILDQLRDRESTRQRAD